MALFAMVFLALAISVSGNDNSAFRGGATNADQKTQGSGVSPVITDLQDNLRETGFDEGGPKFVQLPVDLAQAVHTILDYPLRPETSLFRIAMTRMSEAWFAGSFSKGTTQAFGVIMVSEIGDETFIIAALMAMSHPRLTVFAGAWSALIIMTVLSTAMGVVAPLLISRSTTQKFATVLYTCFGLRLLYISYMSKGGEVQEEYEECKEKLEDPRDESLKKNTVLRFFNRLCTPIFVQALILTFLAEWGDRSQIATIALATHANPLGVTVGAIVGHGICTSIAVLAGKWVATKVSQRTVAAIGGTLFLFFAVHAALVPPDMAE